MISVCAVIRLCTVTVDGPGRIVTPRRGAFRIAAKNKVAPARTNTTLRTIRFTAKSCRLHIRGRRLEAALAF